MSSTTYHTLHDQLVRCKQHLQELKAELAVEEHCLRGNHFEKLAPAVENKMSLVGKVNRTTARIMSIANIKPRTQQELRAKHGADAVTTPEPELLGNEDKRFENEKRAVLNELWTDVRQLATACQTHNINNGRINLLQQNRLRELLAIFQGKSDSSHTYREDGQVSQGSSISASHRRAKA